MEAALELFVKKKFVSGIDSISETSPEITPEFMAQSYGHIGESMSQKSLGSALQ